MGLEGGVTASHGEGNGNPLQCSCLQNPGDGGAWEAAIYGVAESGTTEVTQQQQQQLILKPGWKYNWFPQAGNENSWESHGALG